MKGRLASIRSEGKPDSLAEFVAYLARNNRRKFRLFLRQSLAGHVTMAERIFLGLQMGFQDRFITALGSSDLRDDQFHHQTHALAASAIADASARGIGSLISRVKYADTLSHQFEDGNGNLARLQREWLAIVTEKGSSRRWIRTEDIPTIGHLAPAMYKRVADASLAHYLDGKCTDCRGSGVSTERQMCKPCKGSGNSEITGLSDFERARAMDMLSELMTLESSHSGVANALLRREE